KDTCDYSSHGKKLLLIYLVVDINCDTVKILFCYAYPHSNDGLVPEFASAEYFAFHGHGLSLLRSKERFFRGLRTRPIPIGVCVFCLRWDVFDTLSYVWSTFHRAFLT